MRAIVPWLMSRKPLAVLGVLAATVLLWVGLVFDERAPLVLVIIYIAAPVIWRNPEAGLLATMATIPLEILGVLTDRNLPLTLSVAKVFGALTLLAWVGRIAVERRRPVLWTPELGFLTAFTALAALSIAWAPDGSDAVSMVFRLASAVVLYILTVNLITSRRAARRVLRTFLLSTFVVIAFGFVQPYVMGSYNRDEAGFLDQMHTAELDLTDAAALGGELIRITGTFGFTDGYAFILAILLPLFVFCFEFHRGRWSRVATGVLILLTVASLVMTYSRMGFVGFCISLVLLACYRVLRVSAIRLAVALLLVAAVLPILPTGFWHRVLSPAQYVESKSALSRIDMFKEGAAIVARNWFLGVGIYNLRVVMGREVAYLDGFPSPTYNMYLTIWGDTGIVGLALYLGYLWQSLRGVRLARRNFALWGDREMSALAASVQVSILVLLFCNLFLESYILKPWWSVFALGAALRRMSSRSQLWRTAASEASTVRVAHDHR